MKNKIVLAIMLVLVGVTAHTAFASSSDVAVTCTSDHKVYSLDNTVIVGCISNADWNKSVADQLARQSDNAVVGVAQGQTVVDQHGISSTCTWAIGCVDIFPTEEYITAMQKIARQLIALKTLLSTSRFDGWITSVK